MARAWRGAPAPEPWAKFEVHAQTGAFRGPRAVLQHHTRRADTARVASSYLSRAPPLRLGRPPPASEVMWYPNTHPRTLDPVPEEVI